MLEDISTEELSIYTAVYTVLIPWFSWQGSTRGHPCAIPSSYLTQNTRAIKQKQT